MWPYSLRLDLPLLNMNYIQNPKSQAGKNRARQEDPRRHWNLRDAHIPQGKGSKQAAPEQRGRYMKQAAPDKREMPGA